jgi:hypothetical protein
MSKRDEAKAVLIAAHLDMRFEGHITSGSIDSMPVSGLILELKRCLWPPEHGGTRKRFDVEYGQFLKMIEFPNQERQQAKALGIPGYNHKKVKSVKRHIEDTLIEDGVDRMPAWLWEKCEEIWDMNLKGGVELW